MSHISDVRTQAEFRATSFSKYKMTEVRKEFLASIHSGKIEPACYWCAEMVCSGHFADVWELLISYMARYIHLANPKMAVYLDMRYNVFCNIVAPIENELELRNHDNIRKLFAEVVCSLALSNKKPSFEPMKIDRANDMTRMSERLKAPSLEFGRPIFKSKDPKEMFIAINEFAYHLSVRDFSRACYWIEWGIEFEQICKSRREPCVCEMRHHVPKKYYKDIIWLYWDALLWKFDDPLVEKTMQALFRLFCVKYTTAACKRRRHLLYFAVGLLTEHVARDVDMVPDRTVLETAVQQIDSIYEQIKKNQVSSKQEYLYHGLEGEPEHTTERVLQQLELVNQLDTFGERLLETTT